MLKTLISECIIRIATEEWMVKRAVDALHYLDDGTLTDIGITRANRTDRPMAEAKPPYHWHGAH